MVTWSESFAGYLDKLGLNQQSAFVALTKARVPATQSQVSYWRRGSAYPREATRKKIERWSKGAVSADLPPSESAPTRAAG